MIVKLGLVNTSASHQPPRVNFKSDPYWHACVCVWSFSHVRLFATPWNVFHPVPLSLESFRQDYWSGLPFATAGDLPCTRIEPASIALSGRCFPANATREASLISRIPKTTKTWKISKGIQSSQWNCTDLVLHILRKLDDVNFKWWNGVMERLRKVSRKWP